MQAESSFSISPHWAHGTDTRQDFPFVLVCSALRPFQLRVAVWNSCHVARLPNEATSVGGWDGGVSICLKSKMHFLFDDFGC